MIELRNLNKTFFLNGRRKTVAANINAVFPTGSSVAILGRNGAGKSTLLSMIAGTILPDSGEIISDGAISWPVGFAGSFHQDLTGRQNTYFIARVYGIDTDELAKFVEDFAELGVHFNLPLRSYSSGMRSRLAFGVSMGIPFDTYLVDEVTAVGDASFRSKSESLFLDRMQHGSSVVVTHSMQQVRRLCDMACILENGRLTVYENVDEAIEIHEKNMKKPHPSRAR